MKNNKIMSFLKKVYYTSSSVRYIEFLKKQGVEIGSGCNQKRLKKAPMEAAELVNAFYERKRHYPLPNELTEEEIYYKSDSTFGGRFNSFDEFIEWCKQQKK